MAIMRKDPDGHGSEKEESKGEGEMKKIIAGLLCFSMIGAFSACSKKDTDDTKKETAKTTTSAKVDGDSKAESKDTEKAEDSKTSESADASAQEPATTIWELKDIDVLGTFPEHKYEEITGDDNNTIKVASAAICNPKDEVIASLKSNEWLSSLGVKADIKGEFGHSSESQLGKCSWYYTYDDGFAIFPADKAAKDMYGADIFSVEYHYNTRENIGEASVAVEFNKIDMTDKAVQEKVFAIVKEIYGESFGETLLFAKETDAEKYAKNPDCLYVHETIDQVNINVSRNLKADSMRIHVSCNAEGAKKNGGGIAGGHTPSFDSFKGLPNTVFAGTIGSQQLNDTSLADEFRAVTNFNTDKSYMIEYKLLSYKAENGKEYDTIYIKYEKTIDSALWFEYDVAFDGDIVDKLHIKHALCQCVDHGKSNEENLKFLNAGLSKLFGQDVNIQMSELHENTNGTFNIKTPLGSDKETAYSVQVTVNGQCWWSITSHLY